MHYGRLTFSKNGKPTIVRINDENTDFGRPDDRLSTLDIAEINELYDCSGKFTVFIWRCPSLSSRGIAVDQLV